ncbi:MAG TPA: c-type cytochrome [bacterium]|nr:c-type cytochrome [bacterium]
MHDFAHRTELLSHSLSKPLSAPYSAFTAPTLRTLIATAALGGLLAFGGISPALAEGASGQTIGLTCVVCHGAQGRGTKGIPALAGRNADQTYAALLAYKNGSRPATVMDRHAKGYSDEELRAVADYFASLPAK